MKKIVLLCTCLMAAMLLHAQVSLVRCIELAEDNYPLIKKYDLLARTRDISLSDINKTWLPQIEVYGQGTVQNAVPSFPEAFAQMLSGTGMDVKGLDKLQYKAGVDISQSIWDGGNAKSQRRIAEATYAEQTAAVDVELYAVRERVENLYFGTLLIDRQIEQTEAMLALLQSNLDRLKSMKANGTAMQSDVDMMEAQYLTTSQQLIQLQSTSLSYRRMLGIFTGMDMTSVTLEIPPSTMPDDWTVNRPELALMSAQQAVNQARMDAIESALMPKVGVFAQAYYGYPGLNYFNSMFNRELSFNILAGVKVSWNIGAFYTKQNSEHRLAVSDQSISADRDVFLFNTSLQTSSQSDRIAELGKVIKEDNRIVALRGNVRRAAESQLANGVIDATDLLSKITDENQARLNAAYHEIQLIQSIYQLKYTLNR